MSLTQPEGKLAELLGEKNSELESLQTELLELKENSVAELEQTILNYEQKLSEIREDGEGSSDGGIASESRISELLEQIRILESEKAELESKVTKLEADISTYQNELEQVLANQEEELERNELLQNEIDSLKVIYSRNLVWAMNLCPAMEGFDFQLHIL